MIRAYFLRKIKSSLPEELPINEFSFSAYLNKMMVEQTLEQLEIGSFTWVMALVALTCFYIAFTSHEWLNINGHWIVYADAHRRLGGGGGGELSYSYVDEGTPGAIWRGEYNTGHTLNTSVIVGWLVLGATTLLWFASKAQVTALLDKSGIKLKFNADGTLDQAALWWIDSVDDGSAPSSPAASGKHDGQASALIAGAFEQIPNPLKVNPEWFRRGLDLCTIFNCYYLSFFFINTLMTSIDGHHYWFLLFGPLPAFLMMFVVMPLVTKNYAILLACTAFKSKSETFVEVIKLMVEERELVQQVQEKLNAKNAKFTDAGDGSLFQEIDADNSGTVDHKEFADALQQIGMVMTPKTMYILLRVIDPDASGTITQAELEHFMAYGKGMDRGASADNNTPTPCSSATDDATGSQVESIPSSASDAL
jgi:hypothetical protein